MLSVAVLPTLAGVPGVAFPKSVEFAVRGGEGKFESLVLGFVFGDFDLVVPRHWTGSARLLQHGAVTGRYGIARVAVVASVGCSYHLRRIANAECVIHRSSVPFVRSRLAMICWSK